MANLETDFHMLNLETQGAMRRAGEYGVCDEMNMYIASYIYPEIGREHPETRYCGQPSVTGTLERLMEIERKKVSAR